MVSWLVGERSLEDGVAFAPGMAAGVADHVWTTCEEIAALLH